jgi:hypothetical protein
MAIAIWHCLPENIGNPAEQNRPLWPEKYQKVAVVDTDNLEEAFRLTQHIEEDWTRGSQVLWRWIGRTRSSSIGDVFVLEDQAWIILSFGFEML